MTSSSSGGRGNGKPRFRFAEPSIMLTRQGRRSPDEEEQFILRTLEDAGIPDANMMTETERYNLFKALEESKVDHVEEETQRLSLNSQHVAPRGSIDSLTTSTLGEHSALSSHSDDLFDSLLDSSSPQTPSVLENQSHLSKSHILPKERATAEGIGVRPTRLSLGNTQSPKNAVRGRGVPIRTKYPTLPISSPGQKSSPMCSPTNNYPMSPPNHPSGPISVTSLLSPSDSPSLSNPQDHPPTPESREKNPKSFGQFPSVDASSSQGSQSSSATLSPTKPDSPEVAIEALDDGLVNVETVDEDICAEVESRREEASSESVSSVCESQPDSPASVEDAGEEEGKDPVKMVKVGKVLSQVSPLEAEIKTVPTSQFPTFFKELEQYRGNRLEWMAKAKEAAQEERQALWRKLLAEKRLWGPPVSDGGYNKQTLFKQMAPRYSKLFSSTTDKQAGTGTVRQERQAKSQAMTKIQDTMQDDWTEQEYNSLRKSRQKDTRSKEQSEGREESSAWTSKKKDLGLEGDEDFSQDVVPSGSNERWHSNRIEQRSNLADSDSEVSPDSPNIDGSHDVYEYEDPEIWVATKSKKNFKRAAKSIQGDIEVEGKVSHRGRGGPALHQNQRGRSTRSRVQRGAISRPSEHATNSRNKVGSSDQTEGETNARNTANSERSWIGTDQSGAESSDIAPKKFYSSKEGNPRNHSALQQRRPKENRRSTDSPSSSSSSGNFRQQEARNEAAAVETQECPICGKAFPISDIEAHCSGCVDFKTDAVGEKPTIDIEDSEESDKAVENSEGTKREAKEASVSIKCNQCNQQFTKRNIMSHKCSESVPSSSTGHKRGNSLQIDDGPAKKTTRFMK